MRLGVSAALVDGVFVSGDVSIADGVIEAVGLSNGSGNGIAAPGFVDLQVNGYGGQEFSSPRLTLEGVGHVAGPTFRHPDRTVSLGPRRLATPRVGRTRN